MQRRDPNQGLMNNGQAFYKQNYTKSFFFFKLINLVLLSQRKITTDGIEIYVIPIILSCKTNYITNITEKNIINACPVYVYCLVRKAEVLLVASTASSSKDCGEGVPIVHLLPKAPICYINAMLTPIHKIPYIQQDQNQTVGAGEMARGLRALSALPEDSV